MPGRDKSIRLFTTKGILLWVCLTAFFSCLSTPTGVDKALRQAEAIMEVHPDSAWHLLQRIPSPETLDGESQADYALLMTQARDKNYEDMASSDSLIAIAVDYYNKEGRDRVKRAKTLYYYARVKSDAGEEEKALSLFLDAQRLLVGTQEYKMLGLLMTDLAQINRNQSHYQVAVTNSKEAVRYYRLAQDTLSVAYVYQNIAQIFILEQRMDSASWYTEQSLHLLDVNPIRLRAAASKLRGILYRDQKKYAEAEAALLEALALEPNQRNIYYHYLSLGRLYQLMQQDVKACHFFRLCLNSSDLFTRSDANRCLYEVSKTAGNFRQALLYKDQADSLRYLARNGRSVALTATLQKNYQNEQLKRENLEIAFSKRIQHFIYLFILLVTVLVGYCFYRKYRTESRQRQQALNSIRRNKEEIVVCQARIEKLIQQNQAAETMLDAKVVEVEQNKEVLAKYESEQKMQEKNNDLIAMKIKELEKQVEVLSTKNDRLQLDVVSLLDALKSATLVSSRMDTTEWNLIFSFADYTHGNCISRLRVAYPQLTKNDLRLSALLVVGFTSSQLVAVFEWKDENSLFRAKSRLKERLQLTPSEELREFFQIFANSF